MRLKVNYGDKLKLKPHDKWADYDNGEFVELSKKLHWFLKFAYHL